MSFIFYFCNAYILTNKAESCHFLESRLLQMGNLWAVAAEVALDGAWPSVTRARGSETATCRCGRWLGSQAPADSVS